MTRTTKNSKNSQSEPRQEATPEKAADPATAEVAKPPENARALSSENLHDMIVKAMSSEDIRTKLVESIVDTIVEQVTQSVYQALQMDLDEHREQLNTLDEKVNTLEKKVTALQSVCEEQEQYSRRNCLRFQGIKEVPNECTDDTIRRLASEKMDVELRPCDIDRSHRITPRSGTANGRPHSIIIKFASYNARQAVFSNRTKLKGTNVYVHEDLTAYRQQLLRKVRQSPDVARTWTNDGRIKALLKNNEKVSIRSEKDLEKLNVMY